MQTGRPDPRIRAALWALAVGLAGCAPAPEPRLSEESYDGLRRVENARFGAVFLKPDAGLGSYDALWLRPLSISFKREPRATRGEFPLTQAQQDGLKELFARVFRAELERGGSLRLADGAGAATLEMQPAIVDLVVRAPPPQAAGRADVFIQETADLTLVAELRDSSSGEVLARVADRRVARASGGVYRSTPIRNRAAVEQVFRYWASRLREGLERARELGF